MRIKHVFSVVGALLGIALAVAACDDSHDHDGWYGSGGGDYATSCSDFTACDACTAANGCGWCFNSDGTGTCGDDANQCNTEWTWESNYCRAAADASVSTVDDASSSVPTDAASDTDAAASSDADGDAG